MFPKIIAFYLTQFHPIPENDAWWGKGFTEWSNVTKAKPLFDGHLQPRLPADFGFYDLRVRETRREQIRLAKQHGIDGFCYHYYWFSGKRLLERPLEDMLADSESDMPFCLCWANENWTRRWDAAEHEVLIAQRYLPNDDVDFIQSLIPYFNDSRYIKFEGKPVLVVYRPQHLPDARKTALVWREYCRAIGIGEIHLCAALTHGNDDYEQFGFDAGVEFPPHNITCENKAGQIVFSEPFKGGVYAYEEIATAYLARDYSGKRVHRGCFPSWDNTARTGNRSVIVLGGTPSSYEYWLSSCLQKSVADANGKESFVFVNAWNEWAEGCHLEPDRFYGHQFLQATRTAVSGESKVAGFVDSIGEYCRNAPNRTLFADLHNVFSYHVATLVGKFIGHVKRYPKVKKIIKWLAYGGRYNS